MTPQTVTGAIEKRDEAPPTPWAIVDQYSGQLSAVLPSHVKIESWIRTAQAAVKSGKRLPDGRYELEAAAANNPGAFLQVLRTAARLGLTPATDEFYLSTRKVNGVPEIEGTVGYQGYIELMYRAGAISSVTAEIVYSKDRFAYKPGPNTVPDHDIDWDLEDRGDLRLVYAYATMRDGAISKVVVLNRSDIDKIKASSTSAKSNYSPWNTHPDKMWLKSAVRQLRKWVPTSAEYITTQVRAAIEGQQASAHHDIPASIQTGQVLDQLDPTDIVDGVLVDDVPARQ